MHGGRLISLITKLTSSEFRHFKKFVQSPFFNSNIELIEFYNYISRYYPKLDSRMLSKDQAFRHLYPNEKYEGKKIGYLMSRLSLLIEEYLMHLEFQRSKIEQYKIKIKAFERRNMMTLCKKNIRLLREVLDEASSVGMEHFLTHFQLYEKLYFTRNTALQNSKATKRDLEEAMNNLDLFFTLAKLKLSCEMRSREKIMAEKYSIKFFGETLVFANNRGYDIPLYALFQNLLTLLQQKEVDDVIYLQTKALLKNSIAGLNIDDSLYIFLKLLNYAIIRSNTGDKKLLQESFELYQFGITETILTHDHRITDMTFINIIVIGIKLEKYTWLEKFINDYETYLPKEEREQVKTFCLAFIHYSKSEYKKTRNLLISQGFSYPRHKIRAKSLLLKAIYEELKRDDEEYTLFLAQAQSFDKFLRRTKNLSRENTLRYMNFVKMIRKITKHQMENSMEEELRLKFLQEVEKEKLVANKPWLIEKLQKVRLIN